MTRTARKQSRSGVYHIMMRGVNGQDLFRDDQDKHKFLKTLELYKEKSRYKIYAYCLMTNHIHLLLKEEGEPISLIIKRISSSYVYYYNLKYSRYGHLFQERFKSEVVENLNYLLTVVRYIHQNPQKANMIKKLEKYKWSSYNEYIRHKKIVDIDFILDIFSEDRNIAIQRFIKFNNQENEDKCLEYQYKQRIDDEEAKKIIEDIVKVKDITEIQSFEKEKMDDVIKKIKNVTDLSIRQIARVTGISYNHVLKI